MKWLWLVFAVAFFTFGTVERVNYTKMTRKMAFHLAPGGRETVTFFYGERRMP